MKLQWRVVRENTDNEHRGVYVLADTPADAISAARAISRRENWPGTASNWLVYQDTRQWHPVYFGIGDESQDRVYVSRSKTIGLELGLRTNVAI